MRPRTKLKNILTHMPIFSALEKQHWDLLASWSSLIHELGDEQGTLSHNVTQKANEGNIQHQLPAITYISTCMYGQCSYMCTCLCTQI